MKTITLNEAAKSLSQNDDILVLMHKSPDGDAIGCAYGLCMALRKLGKKAMPVCSDTVSEKYDYITSKLPIQSFEGKYIVTVDLADTRLFGEKLEKYKDCVDLCIDHHGSNTGYARESVVDGASGACAQIVYKIIRLMNVDIDRDIANAIFTGICTDTGCFKYSNASAESYRMAAELIDEGAESTFINRIMFDTKSRARIEIECLALQTTEFYADGKIAVICITNEMRRQSGADDYDTEGISGIPRQIEGVKIGITVNERESGKFKISARSAGDVDVSSLCAVFGGGGHKAAAGCVIEGDLESAKKKIVGAAEKVLTGKI